MKNKIKSHLRSNLHIKLSVIILVFAGLVFVTIEASINSKTVLVGASTPRRNSHSLILTPNTNVSNQPGPQNEPSVAVDPNNPTHLVATSNNLYNLPGIAYVSIDAGVTWSAVNLPMPSNPLVQGGPVEDGNLSVAFGPSGIVYVGYIVVFFNTNLTPAGNEMAVARSSDGGISWTPTYFGFKSVNANLLGDDEPSIAVDNSNSIHKGAVYLAWDTESYTNAGAGINMAYSTDGGVSFSTPTAISQGRGHIAGFGAKSFIDPQGGVHVAWFKTG